MSLIIAQDITQPNDLSNIDRFNINSRDSLVLKSYESEPWLSQNSSSVVDQKLCVVDRDLLFQILMVENISRSKLNQIDDIKAKLDPKYQKVDRLKTGKEKIVINQVNLDNENIDTDSNGNGNFIQSPNKVVFKLTLQDKSGAIFYAINSTHLPWFNVCMLGSKIVIKTGTQFCRGVFILKDSCCVFLGGINRIWNENRESKLCNYLDAKLQRDNNGDGTRTTSKKRKNTH